MSLRTQKSFFEKQPVYKNPNFQMGLFEIGATNSSKLWMRQYLYEKKIRRGMKSRIAIFSSLPIFAKRTVLDSSELVPVSIKLVLNGKMAMFHNK